ncbi:Fe-S-containing hydro-lyase [Mahella australiensis]|uniref:Hydro-lyase, Fe-S type, tartrate/fumarate subfamily, beta subunit n=1 Tax=Mahella australiensis (strain DSM 15567 / CIP 107919 / 50-1 BON) TaxID=697281 RepID=F4A189_MAHA5|nr:Fe-S-containing hydro-lyase [Mahella australiensis]AEE97008.1 hydro-lyase, Fe-S type, tartrate/fumarate subfamily, beta subunit [Mahella australiensis 50-1 BON]
MEIKSIISPLSKAAIDELNAGDMVKMTGIIYTARDAAHKRMIQLLNQNLPLPFDIAGQTIYYAGPCPPKPGQVIGSAGPTTSSRVDVYTPPLLAHGLNAMIGKGPRSRAVIDAMVKYKAVYLAATGGAGALIADCIKKADIVAFEDLGPEAIYRLVVEDLPLIVAIDCHGNSLYS